MQYNFNFSLLVASASQVVISLGSTPRWKRNKSETADNYDKSWEYDIIMTSPARDLLVVAFRIYKNKVDSVV